MDNQKKIFFFWFELIKRKRKTINNVPHEFFSDKKFRTHLLSLYDINVLYKNQMFLHDYIRIHLDKDEINSLNSFNRYILYLSDTQLYHSLLTETLILDILQQDITIWDKYEIDRIKLYELTYTYYFDLLYELDLPIKIYFMIPVDLRNKRLFNLILPKLDKIFNFTESLIEVEPFYYANGISFLCQIPNPTYNICRYYIFKDIENIRDLPDHININESDMHQIIKLNKLWYTSIRRLNIYEYLTIDICDNIIRYTVDNVITSVDDVISVIPIEYISIKTARMLILNEDPLSISKNNSILELFNLDELIKLCTAAGLIFILDKHYHTYDIYINFITRHRTNNPARIGIFNTTLYYNNINFRLFDFDILIYFIDTFNETQEYIHEFPTIELVYHIENRIIKILDIHGVESFCFKQIIYYLSYLKDEEIKYLIYKIPVLELYTNNDISYDRFKSIIYSNFSICTRSYFIIQYMDRYKQTECIPIIKDLILNKSLLWAHNSKYCTVELFWFLIKEQPTLVDLYFSRSIIPDEIDRYEIWLELIQNTNISSYSNIPNKYKNEQLALIYYTKLFGFPIMGSISIDMFYDLLKSSTNIYNLSFLYKITEISSYKTWTSINIIE